MTDQTSTKDELSCAVNAYDRLTEENQRLREALERIEQHAYDDDTPLGDILTDFDHMRDISRAALEG